jgi:magnesium-dependent phosphatase 1
MAKSKKLSKPTSSTTPPPSNSTNPSTPTSPAWLHDNLPLPRLIVLDLDYTLWPFYSDIHPSPPLRLLPASSPATLADRNGEQFALYRDAPHILRLIATSLPNTRLAVASKSPVGDLCREVLKLLRLPEGGDKGGGPKRAIDAFDAGLEIYEGSKLRHFEVLAKRTGIAFSEMLFFDDERPNLEVEKLGVTMRLIKDGLTWEEVERGIVQWRGNRGVV